MEKKNTEARKIVRKRIRDAWKSEKLKDPLEEWVAIQLVDGAFFMDRVEPLYVDFVLQSIDYEDARCVKSVDTVDTIMYKNASHVQQVEVLKRSESLKQDTMFAFTEGIKVGVSEKSTISIGIDELAKIGVELTYFAEFDLQSQQSFTLSKTKTFEVDSTINVPKHRMVTAKILMNKVSFNGWFTAHYVPAWTQAGREAINNQIYYCKQYKGVSLDPLKKRSLVKMFPDLDLRVACKGTLDGVAGRDVVIDVSEEPFMMEEEMI